MKHLNSVCKLALIFAVIVCQGSAQATGEDILDSGYDVHDNSVTQAEESSQRSLFSRPMNEKEQNDNDTTDNNIDSTGNGCKRLYVKGDATRLVCVVNEATQPDIVFDWPQRRGQAILVTSSRSGRRFHVEDLNLNPTAAEVGNASDLLLVNTSAELQEVTGWGGAFTDSTGVNLASLSKELADKLLASYYGPDGLQYNYGRVPIAGTDFSTRAYTYDDTIRRDLDLRNWTLAPEDHEYKIPYIKQAMQLVQSADGDELKLFASPWSPPKWMKENNNIIRGHLIDDDKVYESYAEYLIKFYEAYERNGIKFWGATVQNEPVAANLPTYFFNSLQMTNAQMEKFISKFLGPALHASGRTKDKFKLMIGDDNLGFINKQVPQVMANPEVRKYISGLAFHWYTSGSIVPYSYLTKLYESIADSIEFVLMTEACTGSMPINRGVELGSWDRGESYASDIIEDFQRRTGGWIDWNMALDMEGGPNWSKNFVDSPIIVNSKRNEFYKQPMYYALAHFTRFFRPGFKVVSSEVKLREMRITTNPQAIVAVDKKGGYLVATILNRSNSDRRVAIRIKGELKSGPKLLNVEKRSIVSVVLKL